MKKVNSTPEMKKKIIKKMKYVNSLKRKPILQYTLLGSFIKKWKSLNGASKELKIESSNICTCLKGRAKSAGGYTWKYMEN